MVLNDWQRGKIPYFVKPPESEQDEKLREEKTKTINKLNVRQDYRKIEVEPTFSGDDVKQIENIDPVKESDEEFSDENDEEDVEEIESEMAKKAESKIQEKDAEKFFEMIQADIQKDSLIVQPEKTTIENVSNEEKSIDSDKPIDKSKKQKKFEKKDKTSESREIIKNSSSGAWSVKTVTDKSIKKVEEEDKVKKPTAKKTTKKIMSADKRKAIREIDEEEEVPPKLTGKEVF